MAGMADAPNNTIKETHMAASCFILIPPRIQPISAQASHHPPGLGPQTSDPRYKANRETIEYSNLLYTLILDSTQRQRST
jgi:hypothetical protein